jgi:hypothetical protein
LNSSVAGTEEQLAVAAETCRVKLQEDSYASLLQHLGPQREPEAAFQLLSRITMQPESSQQVGRLCASIRSEMGPSEPDRHAVEQTLLLLASQHAITQVPGLPVSDNVKGLFAGEFKFFANPPAIWLPHFRSDDVRYMEMARVATLRRFPAGQFQWEAAAFPASQMARVRQPWRVLAYLIRKMGGFGPLIELHVNERRKNRLILLEKESHISYYRAARSIEKQPQVRGVVLTSWLFCESTAQITPHLAWLRRTPQSAGALIVDLGPAPPDSGFLTGSEERRKLYQQGLYRPKDTCILWPRKLLIDWANQHPEFDL